MCERNMQMAQHSYKTTITWGVLWLSLSALGLTGAYPLNADEVVDRIVAVVNDDIITDLEVRKEMLPYEERINHRPGN